jgi:hypothetical protein
LAIVSCTVNTVQLALFSTTAISVSLISISPDRKISIIRSMHIANLLYLRVQDARHKSLRVEFASREVSNGSTQRAGVAVAAAAVQLEG